MKHRAHFRACWLATLAAFALPAAAHHGTLVSYDRSQQWTRDAVVTRLHYANPHPQLYFDLTNDDGEVEQWASELLPNPAALIRNGWTRARSMEALQPGTPVKVTIAPAKAGGTVGLLLRVTDMAGTDLVTDGLPPPPAAPAAPATP